jgi:hypothetical protein
MPILGIIASSKLTAVPSSFESIATVSVSSATQPITFSSIPQTFTHLQLRGIARSSRNAYINNLHLRFNSLGPTYMDLNMLIIDTTMYTGTNGNDFSAQITDYFYMPTTQFPASVFGGYVFDIYDYTNTNKNKVIHAIGGAAQGGSNTFGTFTSKTMKDTAAITSITLSQSGTTNFEQYSHWALYGIKA